MKTYNNCKKNWKSKIYLKLTNNIENSFLDKDSQTYAAQVVRSNNKYDYIAVYMLY